MTTQTLPTVAPGETAPLFLSAPVSPAAPEPAALDPLAAAVERQAAAALSAVRAHDPEAWLFLERTRYLAEGTCDPYAELMLRRAGFLTDASARVGAARPTQQ